MDGLKVLNKLISLSVWVLFLQRVLQGSVWKDLGMERPWYVKRSTMFELFLWIQGMLEL